MHLFPKNPDFFIWFLEMAQALQKQSLLLSSFEKNPHAKTKLAKKIRVIETDVDRLMHTIDTEADTTFMTPFDREDLHALARELNTIADSIENAASGMLLAQTSKNGAHIHSYFSLVKTTVTYITSLLSDLSKKDTHVARMKKTILSIHDLENEGDDLYRKEMQMLFAKQHDARTIIKWNYIYDNLELVLDACERTAEIANTIIIKNY